MPLQEIYLSLRKQFRAHWNGLNSDQCKKPLVIILFAFALFGSTFLAGTFDTTSILQLVPSFPLAFWKANLTTPTFGDTELSASQNAIQADSATTLTHRAVELQKVQLHYEQVKKNSLQSAWEAYKEVHATAFRERKLFLYTPYQSGQGNRLPGIVTAFMLALLSQRALLIDYCRCIQITQGECTCQWGDLFDQEETELDAVSLLHKDPGLDSTLRNGSLTQVDFAYDALTLNLADLADRPILWGNGSMDWTAHLWLANPHHGETLRALFRPGYIFQDVAHLLMRPSKMLKELRDQWVETRFRPLTIGVHVRMMALGRLVARKDPKEFVPFFMHLARSLQTHRGIPDEQTAIYLAADRGYVRDAWEKYLGNTSIALLTQPKELVFTNETALESGLDRYTRRGVQIAVLEMLLLGASDEVIGTRASTFSHVAAAFGGVRPWMIDPFDGYYGSATSDPCFWNVKPLTHDWKEPTTRWFDFAPESFLHFPCAHF